MGRCQIKLELGAIHVFRSTREYVQNQVEPMEIASSCSGTGHHGTISTVVCICAALVGDFPISRRDLGNCFLPIEKISNHLKYVIWILPQS
jgi:hypothetical protein